jgi:hypothetical protein
LAREAAMLADRYPAETAPAFPPPEVRLADSKAVQRAAPPPANRGQAGRFFGPALALLLAISVAAVFVWSQSNDGPAEPVGGKQEWSVSFRPAGDRQPSETSTGEESPGAGVPLISSPATFVHELTGPEIEGLLDLLECEDAAESRLSI